MGYTHWDKIVGVTGVYTGAKDSEVKIADASGLLYAGTSGTNVVADGSGVRQKSYTHVFYTGTSTAAQTSYIVAPFACTPSAVAVFGISAGTGRQVTITGQTGTGAILLDTGAIGVTGTAGTAVAMTNSSGTTTVTANEIMAIAFASCATAQLPATCVVTFSRTA